MSTPIDRINDAASAAQAEDHLRTYFGPGFGTAHSPGFSGAWFERIGNPTPEDMGRLTADDVLSLSMLSVAVPGEVSVKLLRDHRERIEELLAAIPRSLPIWEADETVLAHGSPAAELWTLIYRTGPTSRPAQRWTSAYKLCARKRPALLPVYDGEVDALVQPEGAQWWLIARQAMRQDALRHRLDELKAAAMITDGVGVAVLTTRGWRSARSPAAWSR